MSLVVGQVPGIPGGVELLVILLLGVVMVAFPLVLILIALAFVDTGNRADERIEDLEREVEELREQQRGEQRDDEG